MPLMMPASFLQATNPHNHYLHRAYCVHPVESTIHSAIFIASISDRIQGFVESLFVESHLGGATDNEVPTHYADTQLKFFSLSGSPKSFQNPDFVIPDNFVFA